MNHARQFGRDGSGRIKVIVGQCGDKAAFHLVVRQVEQERLRQFVIALYSEIATLINHGQRALHIGLVVHKVGRSIVSSRQVVKVLVVVCQQAYEVSGRARAEPVILQFPVFQCREQTEGVVNVEHLAVKVVAVVAVLQFERHLLSRHVIFFGHLGHLAAQAVVQFVLRDAAQGLESGTHADVVGLVKAAEHAHLRELGHAREQHKLQMRVGRLEGGVEAFENAAVVVLDEALLAVHLHFKPRVHHVEQRLVILVNQHHAAFARGFVHMRQQLRKAVACAQLFVGGKVILRFPLGYIILHLVGQCHAVLKVRAVKVHMKHRVALPILFERIDGQPLEQFAFPLKVVFERRHKQALAKSPRATQEVGLSAFHELVNQVGLVNVEISIFDDALKVLYANGKFHNFRV